MLTNVQLASFVKELVNAAAKKNIVLRALGGVAIYMTCPSIESHATLQRSLEDVDFVAPRSEWDKVVEAFVAQGLVERNREAHKIVFEKDGTRLELFSELFRENFPFDLSSRLALSTPTLPFADLLLIKLQRGEFKEKDIQDSIALLLDHRVAREEAEEQISYAYIGEMTRANWARFHTVYDNTITLESILPKYLESEEAQLVWRRIELIQGEMDRLPKSFGWMLKQFVRKPSEVAR